MPSLGWSSPTSGGRTAHTLRSVYRADPLLDCREQLTRRLVLARELHKVRKRVCVLPVVRVY